jgi:multiple sugar transport system substrate-binding protein
MEDSMKRETPVSSPTTPAKLDRRSVLKGAAAGVAATALGPVSKRSTFAAPAFLQGTTIVFALQDTDAPSFQPLIDDYAKANNVTIDAQQNPYATLQQKQILNLTQETGAYDVVEMDDPWMPQFAGGKFLMSLQELMDKKGIKVDEDFIPELLALGDFPKGTGLRGIPCVGNVQVYAWRSDVLQDMKIEVPKTWDDVLAAAKAITEAKSADGLYGIGLRGQPGNPAATSFLPVLRGYGTDLFNDKWEPQLDTPQALAALNTQLALAKLAPPGVENVGHADNGRNMYEGITAQSADIWPDLLLQIYDPKLSKVVGKVDIGGEPAQEGVKPANMTGNWLLGIPEGSQNADAALDFILWFTAPEQQLRLLMNGNVPPTRTSVMQNADAVAKFPFLPGLLTAAHNAVPRPRTPSYNAVEAIYGQYVAQAIAGQISAEDALKKSNQEIRDVMIKSGELKA